MGVRRSITGGVVVLFYWGCDGGLWCFIRNVVMVCGVLLGMWWWSVVFYWECGGGLWCFIGNVVVVCGVLLGMWWWFVVFHWGCGGERFVRVF